MTEGRLLPPRVIDAETEHKIQNHLAIIAGLCDLLLGDTPTDDPRHADLQEVSRAARALIAIFRRQADRESP